MVALIHSLNSILCVTQRKTMKNMDQASAVITLSVTVLFLSLKPDEKTYTTTAAL